MQKGDKAIVNFHNPCFSPLTIGDIVTIIDSIAGTYAVMAANGVTWGLLHTDVDAFTALPRGAQLNLGPVEEPHMKCDCGGYKTFKSMSPEYHSHSLPCSSLEKV